MSIYINHIAALCTLGKSTGDIEKHLFSATQSPLRYSEAFTLERPLPLGIIDFELPTINEPEFNSRNNQLLLAALMQLGSEIEYLKQNTPSSRIGIVIGSSTSGIREGEQAIDHYYRHGLLPGDFDYRKQEIGAPSVFVKHLLRLSGPAWTISTACTSGAKALASAARLVELDICDAVIAGGADTLCRLTVEGFASLSAISPEPCLPFSANRRGINIGEGAALAIVSREPAPIRLRGYGESSDAYHISAPHPQGTGAVTAMENALQRANLTPDQVDYLNLHGTGTIQNDGMEATAVHRVFGEHIHCGSTKALTGHTLGAAGALEAVFSILCLQRDDGRLPVHLWDRQYDKSLPRLANIASEQCEGPVRAVMSNSFAFGGNNIALIMDRP